MIFLYFLWKFQILQLKFKKKDECYNQVISTSLLNLQTNVNPDAIQQQWQVALNARLSDPSLPNCLGLGPNSKVAVSLIYSIFPFFR